MNTWHTWNGTTGTVTIATDKASVEYTVKRIDTGFIIKHDDDTYIITEKKHRMECSCPAWNYSKSPQTCKHVKAIGDIPMGNMDIWNEVCRTDPAITKHVNQRGGFTAIDTQCQIKKATEVFGPMGIGWGLKNCVYGEVRGDSGLPVELYLEAMFWFKLTRNADTYCGEFEISSDIEYKVKGDCRKKLRSDVIGKALSNLGFNSDVYEGKFDDAKYVEEAKKEASKANSLKQEPTTKPVDAQKQEPAKTNQAKFSQTFKDLVGSIGIAGDDDDPIRANEIMNSKEAKGLSKSEKDQFWECCKTVGKKQGWNWVNKSWQHKQQGAA